jgi:hypothetical protein
MIRAPRSANALVGCVAVWPGEPADLPESFSGRVLVDGWMLGRRSRVHHDGWLRQFRRRHVRRERRGVRVGERCPLTRRNCPRTSITPAAHQLSAMVPFCPFFTLLDWVRAMEIIDSMQLVERNVRASVWSRSTHISGSTGKSARSRPAICSGDYFFSRSSATLPRGTTLDCLAGLGREARSHANACAVVAR